MKGNVLFITGAAKGIGFEIAKAFAKEGVKVVISDLNEDKLKEATQKIEGEVSYVICDVSKESDIKAAIDFTVQTYGKIDYLINNAGLQHVALIEDFPSEKFSQMINIMLVGPFLTTKYALPYMRSNGFGRIMNIASINGVIGFEGKAAYNSAKHGVIGLTKVTALETARDNITVNAICPGYVNTELVRNQYKDIAKTRGITEEEAKEGVLSLVPQHRLLEVEEIASLALYIASDAAKGMTGQAVILDGGYTVK